MKLNKIFLMAASVALGLTACDNSENNSSGVALELHTYNYDLIGISAADSTTVDSLRNWRLSGDCVLPVKIGNNDITALKDSLLSLAGVSISSGNVVSPSGNDDMTISDLNPKTTNAPSTRVNSLSIDLLTSTVVVWENYNYEYQAFMAHGMAQTDYLNYSIYDNKILSLADIMKRGYEKPLLALILEELKAQDVPLNVATDEITIPDNFRIRANSIEFIFPPMSIAPYSEGDVRIRLSLMDLQGVLTEKGIRLILGTQAE